MSQQVELVDEPLKRGETFEVDIPLVNDADQPVDLDLVTNQVSAVIRQPNGVILATATVTKTDTLGTYKVAYSGSTKNWPLEVVRTDIRAVIDGKIRKSKPTTAVKIILDETPEPEPTP